MKLPAQRAYRLFVEGDTTVQPKSKAAGPEEMAGFNGSWNIVPLERMIDFVHNRKGSREWWVRYAEEQFGHLGLHGTEAPFSPMYHGGNIVPFAAVRAVALDRQDVELASLCERVLDADRGLGAIFTLPWNIPGRSPFKRWWMLSPGMRSYTAENAFKSDLNSPLSALLLDLPFRLLDREKNTRLITFRILQEALRRAPLPAWGDAQALAAAREFSQRALLIPKVVTKLQEIGLKLRAVLNFCISSSGYSSWYETNINGNAAPCYAVTVFANGNAHTLCPRNDGEPKAFASRAGSCGPDDTDTKLVYRTMVGNEETAEERTGSIPKIVSPYLYTFKVGPEGVVL